MKKTDDELLNEVQRLGPIGVGTETWPHLDLALWRATRLGGPQRLVVQGNTVILGHVVEAEQVARLIERCSLRWATTGVWP